jgi:hypothetical protein
MCYSENSCRLEDIIMLAALVAGLNLKKPLNLEP